MFDDTIHLIAVLEEGEAPNEELALLPEYEDVCQDDYRVIVIYGENKRQILYAEDNMHGRPFDIYEGILQGLRYAEKIYGSKPIQYMFLMEKHMLMI